jgi:Inner membrane protein involved in colicin E2 resistance
MGVQSVTQPLVRAEAGRSYGLKALLVCLLSLAMAIPALFVFLILLDRQNSKDRATVELAQMVGANQQVTGPVLLAPFTRTELRTITESGTTRQVAQSIPGIAVIFADQGEADVDLKTEIRKRSLFEVPIYEATATFTASFALDRAPDLPRGSVIDWSQARIYVSVSGQQGVLTSPQVRVNGVDSPLEPFVLNENGDQGFNDGGIRGLSADIDLSGSRENGPSVVEVTTDLHFSGAEQLSFAAFARDTKLTVAGDWPHPGFTGEFLARERKITDQGFTASWDIPYAARGVPGSGDQQLLQRLNPSNVQINLTTPSDPYQSVARALKYALMFIGIVFLTYFLFETVTGKRAHPAQYLMVGLAQCVFYLLLLAFAEQIGFTNAFIVAAVPTVLLLGWYVAAVFDGVARGVIAVFTFGVLYSLIYVLMRLEDYALIVGALVAFVVIAVVMWVTRRLDWYGGRTNVIEGLQETIGAKS